MASFYNGSNYDPLNEEVFVKGSIHFVCTVYSHKRYNLFPSSKLRHNWLCVHIYNYFYNDKAVELLKFYYYCKCD